MSTTEAVLDHQNLHATYCQPNAAAPCRYRGPVRALTLLPCYLHAVRHCCHRTPFTIIFPQKQSCCVASQSCRWATIPPHHRPPFFGHGILPTVHFSWSRFRSSRCTTVTSSRDLATTAASRWWAPLPDRLFVEFLFKLLSHALLLPPRLLLGCWHHASV
jgi:hypothetical protein